MWIGFLVMPLLFVSGNCENFTYTRGLKRPSTHLSLIPCFTNIIQKYFTEAITYVDFGDDSDGLLRSIHSSQNILVSTRSPGGGSLNRNPGYVIISRSVSDFEDNVIYLNRDAGWNPYARFLVVIKSLESYQLRQIFDVFIKLRVRDVVIINTNTTELYTYNPYDNFACGKYYTRIVEFGKCLDITTNIYPEKVTTGLRNCFFNVSASHWPPFAMDPALTTDGTHPIGIEQYIFDLISKVEHFKYRVNFDYDPEFFSLVSNTSVTGPMVMLILNQTDVMLGGLILVPSRANKFFYISGHLDYKDDVRIMVKKAEMTPIWKGFYLEFPPLIWSSLLLVLVLFSILLSFLLKAKDRGLIVLLLLDCLLGHGSKLQSRQTVKCVFIFWVWFAYLINCFYTTSLMSFTTKPGHGYQISDEETAEKMDLIPCISAVMNGFTKSEVNYPKLLKDVDTGIKGCEKTSGSLATVGQSENMFTFALNSVYLYYKPHLCDEYGQSSVYAFKRPYSKIIYGIYFNNGFPMHERLYTVALRIREAGLVDQNFKDLHYNESLKHWYRSRGFKGRFVIPWYPYIAGIFISSVTFVIELYRGKSNIAPVT